MFKIGKEERENKRIKKQVKEKDKER